MALCDISVQWMMENIEAGDTQLAASRRAMVSTI